MIPATDLMYCRSMLPSGRLGVPTVMKEISELVMASSGSVVEWKVCFAREDCSAASSPCSKMGGLPWLMVRTFSVSMSMPMVLIPFWANVTAVQSPT